MRGGSRTGGEIIEVQGGHIVRSTGRKDRHSKVCTAKGPRDRRVRLSAHTAIQFYDVQDRLGYDRPSKAVDWLIKKAKSAIDELAELPAWNPTTTTTPNPLNTHHTHHHETESPVAVRRGVTAETTAGVGTHSSRAANSPVDFHHHHQQQQQQLLPPSFDTDMVSFFPTSVTAEETTSSSSMIQFQSYPPDLLSRTSSSTHNNNNNQDLRLSLQSFQDPVLLHQHQAQTQTHHHHHQNEHEHVLFSGTTPLGGFDGMVAWNAGADAGNNGHGGAGGSGFIFNTPSPSPAPSPAMFLGQSQYLSQRGPLQSSNTPSVRAWIEPSGTFADHHYLSPAMMNQSSSSVSGIGFASGGGGFSGFRIPARIQGEEEHDGVSDKPSSVSSDSRH